MFVRLGVFLIVIGAMCLDIGKGDAMVNMDQVNSRETKSVDTILNASKKKKSKKRKKKSKKKEHPNDTCKRIFGEWPLRAYYNSKGVLRCYYDMGY